MVQLAVEPVALEFESEHGWTPNQDWTHHQRATEVGLKLGGRNTEVVYMTGVHGREARGCQASAAGERVVIFTHFTYGSFISTKPEVWKNQIRQFWWVLSNLLCFFIRRKIDVRVFPFLTEFICYYTESWKSFWNKLTLSYHPPAETMGTFRLLPLVIKRFAYVHLVVVVCTVFNVYVWRGRKIMCY